MSRIMLVVLACLASSAAPGQVAARDCDGAIISESAVRFASRDAYSRLLLQSYKRGRLFEPQQIEKGFRRHFEELKLQLENRGYAVLPDDEIKTILPATPHRTPEVKPPTDHRDDSSNRGVQLICTAKFQVR